MAKKAGEHRGDREQGQGGSTRGKRVRLVLVVAGVVVVIGGGVMFWATSAPSAPGYRLATAGPASVTATLDTTGTIQSVKEATLSFPTTGQVSAVNVAVGQQVTAGQKLAALSTTSLESQVANAQSALASAQARLAADQVGQTSSSAKVTPALYVTASSSAPSDLKSAQDAVTAAQKQVDADMTAASASLTDQQKKCQTVIHPDPSQPPSKDDVDACTAAIRQAQTAQDNTQADELKLAAAESALSDVLAKQVSAPAPTAPGAPSPAPKSAPTPPSTGKPSAGKPSTGNSGSGNSRSGNSGSGNSPAPGTKTSTPASPEQLAADQAAIDSANAQVAVAQQNLAAATLVSPIAGTVGQIGLTTGQTESSQQTIVVLGPGADQVTTAVSDTQAGKVKPGQNVLVTPDGGGGAISGQVTSIGLLSSTTSSGSPSYPVTISLPATGQQLHEGATASVSIITSTANATVTVPTSAVHLTGSSASVTTLSGGQTAAKRVTAGVMGSSLTEIRSGLSAGDQVVLADLSQPLPTSGSTRGLTGGGGRGGAGGGPGGGFGGGAGGAPGGGGPRGG
jgi:HlyD family secretion protein